MFQKLWKRTKEVASKYTKIFIAVMLLNQLLFFGLCLNPICLVAAMPHVLAITVAIGLFWDKLTGNNQGLPTDENTEDENQIFERFREVDLRKHIGSELSKLPEVNRPPIAKLVEGADVLEGIEHHKYLIQGIHGSQSCLIIMSGWLSKYVMDTDFLKLLSSKLKQGVRVYIGFGFQDHEGKHNDFGNSKAVLNSLRKLIQKHPNCLFVASFATHEKLLIVDNKVVVIGSANWLSNKRYINSERSFIIKNKEFASLEAERAILLVKDNLIT